MKVNNLSLLAILIALPCAQAEQPSLQLELETPVRTLRLGQSRQLKLQISGSEIYEITEGSEGIDVNNLSRERAFVYTFNFKPQRKGIFTFGPYSIVVNGQKLTSNQVEINVLPQWDGTYGTFFRVDTNSIALGESVELVMESWSKEHDFTSIHIVRNESFTSSNSGGVTSSSFMVGDDRVSCMTRSWFITPKNPGEFQITKELFNEFPEDTQGPNFTIQINEIK